ncbi:T9SS type A sorting domain-containing protein, partial [Bacteroidota bacterium]
GGVYQLTATVSDPAKKNPTFATASAGIDAGVNTVCAITLKNSSVAGPTYLRISFPDGGSRTYINQDITNSDADFKTYYFDLNGASGWSGTVNDIKFHFKTTGNTDYFVPATPATLIEIDEINFYAEGAASYSGFVQNPDFDDTEGVLSPWDINTGTTTTVNYVKDGGVTNGALAINYSAALANGDIKVENNYTYALSPNIGESDSVNLTYYHKLAAGDDATAEEIQVCFKLSLSGGGTKTFYQGWKTPTTTFTPEVESRSLDDGDAGTTNIYTDITVFFRARNGNSDTVIYLDDITSSIESVLDVQKNLEKKSEFTVYPNPVRNVLNFTSKVALIEMFSVLGQKVKKAQNTNSIDVSNLDNGSYVVRITDQEGNFKTQRIIKY